MARRPAICHCLEHYPRYSWQRRFALCWNLAAIAIFGGVRDPRISARKRAELSSLLRSHDGDEVHFVLTHKFAEKGRLYVMIFNPQGTPIRFAKVSVRPDDHALFAHEQDGLSRIRAKKTTFHTPSIEACTRPTEMMALIMTPTPRGAFVINKQRIPEPLGLIEEISNGTLRMVSSRRVRTTSWWPAFEQTAPAEFKACIDAALGTEGEVCLSFAHGDFGSENIYVAPSADYYFVIDWECWAEDAPMLTDRLAYWLGRNHGLIQRKANKSAFLSRFFHDDFVAAKGVAAHDAALALAFMVARGFGIATIMAQALGKDEAARS